MSTETFRHEDGQVCRYLPYALDTQVGLLHGWFTGQPPEMRKCHREHGLEGAEDESNDSE